MNHVASLVPGIHHDPPGEQLQAALSLTRLFVHLRTLEMLSVLQQSVSGFLCLGLSQLQGNNFQTTDKLDCKSTTWQGGLGAGGKVVASLDDVWAPGQPF